MISDKFVPDTSEFWDQKTNYLKSQSFKYCIISISCFPIELFITFFYPGQWWYSLKLENRYLKKHFIPYLLEHTLFFPVSLSKRWNMSIITCPWNMSIINDNGEMFYETFSFDIIWILLNLIILKYCWYICFLNLWYPRA